jgi:hypothetical protein
MTNDTHSSNSSKPGRQPGRWQPVMWVASVAMLAIAGGVLALTMVATLTEQGTLDGRVNDPLLQAAQTVASVALPQRLDAAPEELPPTF